MGQGVECHAAEVGQGKGDHHETARGVAPPPLGAFFCSTPTLPHSLSSVLLGRVVAAADVSIIAAAIAVTNVDFDIDFLAAFLLLTSHCAVLFLLL
jgi:hypothetical protein